MTKEKALQLRAMIVKASASLEDADALTGVELFPTWQAGSDYVRGQRVRRLGLLYRLIPETHHAQTDWPPELTPAVWARVADPVEEWPEWVRPLGSEDAYPAGARVSHNGCRWRNVHGDGNIWEPGVYGWEEAV